ncbi:MAG TPA: OmpA family protein [Steroidobacteraceae bacterium]|nr:OmpA family protein [Steroidobacteraceae bacterium]
MRSLALCALVSLAPLSLAPMVANAGDEVGHWYVNPQIGDIRASNDRLTRRSDWLYGLGFGKHLSQYFSAEVNFNTTRLKDRFDPGHLNLYAGTLDGLAVFNRGGVVAPYLSLGAGGLRNNASVFSHTTDFIAQAGGGLFIKLWENSDASRSFSLRPDLKARWDDRNGGLWDYLGTVGFVYSFGPGKAHEAPAAAPPPPPPAEPAPAPPPPVATTPPDSDHDGVPDSEDRCPGTPAGVSVDQYGCPLKGSITLEGVNFEVNSAVLTQQSLPVLDNVADGLRKHPRFKVEVQGHTDSSGSAPYNLVLSRKRANSVVDYLVKQGVSPDQVVAKGYGKTQPVASNATPAGRAQNRRVVMSVLDNPGDVQVKDEQAK